MITSHVPTLHKFGFYSPLSLTQGQAACKANKDHPNEKISKNCKLYEKRFNRQLKLHHRLSHWIQPIAAVELPHKLKEISATFEDVFNIQAAKNEVCSAGNKLPANAEQILSAFKSNAVALATLKREDTGIKSEENKDVDVNSAFNNVAVAQEFYQEVHGLDLNEMLGGPLLSLVRFGPEENNPKGLANAFWNGFMMVYGCGGKLFTCLSHALDVAIHEISHAVTQMIAGTAISPDGKPTGLNYAADSGGINEANSDQAAAAAVQKHRWKNAKNLLDQLKAKKASSKEIKKQQALVDNLADPTVIDDNRWKIAHGIIRSNKEACLRDMAHPGTAYVEDPILGTDIQAGYNVYNAEKYAIGDPHQTSAVGNKWFYELSCELYNSLGVPTWDIAEKLRFSILPYCHSDVTYPQYAEYSVKLAKRMDAERVNADKKAGHESKNPHAIEEAVKAAWNKVGIQA